MDKLYDNKKQVIVYDRDYNVLDEFDTYKHKKKEIKQVVRDRNNDKWSYFDIW